MTCTTSAPQGAEARNKSLRGCRILTAPVTSYQRLGPVKGLRIYTNSAFGDDGD
jgi:hypothetical protein